MSAQTTVQPSSSPAEKPAPRRVNPILHALISTLSIGILKKRNGSSEASFVDPPATANSIGYVVPPPQTPPFNAETASIPDEPEGRGGAISSNYDNLQYGLARSGHPIPAPQAQSPRSAYSSPKSVSSPSPASSPHGRALRGTPSSGSPASLQTTISSSTGHGSVPPRRRHSRRPSDSTPSTFKSGTESIDSKCSCSKSLWKKSSRGCAVHDVRVRNK